MGAGLPPSPPLTGSCTTPPSSNSRSTAVAKGPRQGDGLTMTRKRQPIATTKTTAPKATRHTKLKQASMRPAPATWLSLNRPRRSTRYSHAPSPSGARQRPRIEALECGVCSLASRTRACASQFYNHKTKWPDLTNVTAQACSSARPRRAKIAGGTFLLGTATDRSGSRAKIQALSSSTRSPAHSSDSGADPVTASLTMCQLNGAGPAAQSQPRSSQRGALCPTSLITSCRAPQRGESPGRRPDRLCIDGMSIVPDTSWRAVATIAKAVLPFGAHPPYKQQRFQPSSAI